MDAPEPKLARPGPEGTWSVYRQDDNGNRFVGGQRLNRQEAERLVAEFEARGHKQAYWIEPHAE